MKIHVYTLTRDEEYMIQYFLRHYLTFADHIFVIDDNSVDGTQRIAKAAPNVTVLPYTYPSGMNEEHLGQAYVNYYKLCSRGKADWVICVDVDEFIYDPMTMMLTTLEVAQVKGYNILKSTGYSMVAMNPPTGPFQIYDEIKTGVRCKGYDKTLIFDPMFDISFGAGRHTMNVSKGARVGDVGLKLLHYHDLSAEYLEKRIRRNFSRMVQSPLKTLEMEYRVRRGLRAYRHALKNYEKVV